MKENTAKIIISAIAAGLSAYFRVMAIPIVILVLVMIIDYITGMWKAWNRGELSSRVGLKGPFRKRSATYLWWRCQACLIGSLSQDFHR